MNRQIGVLLVDDHAMLRKGLTALLSAEPDINVVGEAVDGEQAIAQVRALKPDVVVMDISMPGLSGIDATRQIRTDSPNSKVIALSIHAARRFVDGMLDAGAAGYLLKESAPEELVQGIRAVMSGEMYLSSAIASTVVSAYVEAMDRGADVGTEILQTKLHRPAPPQDLVSRTRLLGLLEAARIKPLILVAAPAGYGKSVLVSSWLENTDWPGTWLSLDEDDSELRRFLCYVIAALRRSFAGACEQTEALTGAATLPSGATVASTLSNELDALENPFVLVLDDYHRIHAGSPVNELIDRLLALPPLPLHLVIISRRDPPLQLSALRAKDQMNELRMQDLRFSRKDTLALLQQHTKISLSEDALTGLEQQVEGWAVGLRMLILALSRAADQEKFLAQVGGGVIQVRDYLVHEVIEVQPRTLRDWLLKSAILERFCAPLCDAVCAQGDATAASDLTGGRFIQALRESNLFVIPLDPQDEWFRYHHLFQQLLRHELKRHTAPEAIPGLHLRASEWFETKGLIDEALVHALEAKHPVRAAQIVERHRRDEQDRDRWRNVEKWLARLPAGMIEQRPQLLLSQAWILHDQYQLAHIAPIVKRLESFTEREALDNESLGELSFFNGVLQFWAGNAGLSRKLFAEALALVSERHPRISGLIEIYLALARYAVGEGDEVLKTLNNSIENGEFQPSARLSRLILARTFLGTLSGALPQATQDAGSVERMARQDGIAYMEGWGRYLQGASHFRSNDLHAALSCFRPSFDHRYSMHTRAAIDSMVALALTYQALQRQDAATQTIDRMLAFAREMEEPKNLAAAQSGQARLALAQGKIESATVWLRSFDGQASGPEMFVWLEVPSVTQARVLLAIASGESLRQASELLATLRDAIEAQHNVCQTIDILVLQSLTLEKLGRAEEALSVLEQALILATPGGWIRPFIEPGQPMDEMLKRLAGKRSLRDFVGRLRSVFRKIKTRPSGAAAAKSATGAASAAITEPFTRRELDILGLLAQRLQNKEIAARLFVSPETVKTHLKSLYHKLDVSNRRDAAARATAILDSLKALQDDGI